MPVVTGTINRVEAITAHFRTIPPKVRVRVQRILARFGVDMVALIQANLSGPLLRARSGNLRRSITTTQLESDHGVEQLAGIYASGGTHSGTGRSPIVYGSVHEFGFTGVVTVRSHLRAQRMVFGLPMAPRQVQIPAHTKAMHFPPKFFLRSALDALAPKGVADIHAAVAEGVHA